MKIILTSVLVDDQAKALAFYTDVLGFVKKNDIPLGGAPLADRGLPRRRPTASSCSSNPTATPPRSRSRPPWSRTGSRSPPSPSTTCSRSTSGSAARRALHAGADEMGPVTTAVLDDTCGNLIQIAQHD